MNVAVVNSGPGVSCPTATASSNWLSLMRPGSTNASRRNASNR